MELHIPHSVHPKIQKENHVQSGKNDVREIIIKLCKMKDVKLVEGAVCLDHIHLYVAIPPKQSISEFMGYLKGKSALMLFDIHPEFKQKGKDRHFWARGYLKNKRTSLRGNW